MCFPKPINLTKKKKEMLIQKNQEDILMKLKNLRKNIKKQE